MGRPGEDVVGSAVDYSDKLLSLVATQGVLHGLDYGNPAADCALEMEIEALAAGKLHDIMAVFGDKFLVGANHVLAIFQRAENILLGRADAPDQLADDIN